MFQPLTKEIIENDELWRKRLWRELYEAVLPLLPEIAKELNEYEQEILYGTGESEPVGILNGTALSNVRLCPEHGRPINSTGLYYECLCPV